MAKDKTLELSIQIAGKVDKSLMSAISQAERGVSGLSKTMSKIGTVGLATMAAGFTAVTAAIIDCTKEAADWRDTMKDSTKYVPGLADELGNLTDEYNEYSKALLRLTTQAPIEKEQAARISASLGQSGFERDEIIKPDGSGVLKDVLTIAAAWDADADEIGNTVAKWENTFSKNGIAFTHNDVMDLADFINYQGANNPTTALSIANVVNDSASLGQIAGAMDPRITAALATAGLSSGIDEAKMATSINRIYANISRGSSATKAQAEMWAEMGMDATEIAKSMQKDPSGTLVDIFEGIQNLPDYRRVAAINTLFGQWAVGTGANIAGNLDLFKKGLEPLDNREIYKGSMEREYNISNATPEAVRLMRDNAFDMLKINFGDSFVDVQKTWDNTLKNLFLTLNDNMPQLSQLAGSLADLASQGVAKLGDALQTALPYIQKALDYVSTHGDTVVTVLGGMAATFAGMKAAPLIETILGGGSDLLFGKQGAFGKKKGGLASGLVGIFTGGQNAANTLFKGAQLGMQTQGGAQGAAMGVLATLQNYGGLFGGNKKNALAANRNLYSTLANANGGLGGMISSMFSNSKAGKAVGGIGNWFGNIGTAIQGVGQTQIGGAIGGIGQTIGGGLKNLGGMAAGGIGNAVTAIAASRPGQMISGAIGGIGNMAGNALGGLQSMGGAIGGVLSGPMSMIGSFGGSLLNVATTALGPIGGMFGSILTGALPIVGVISGIIAVFSILYDNLDGVREIIGNVFGEQGLAVFDSFKGGLDSLIGSISDILNGGLASALEPIKEKVVGFFDSMFGSDAADMASQTFDSITMILQSVLGVVGQVVDFAVTYVKPIIEEIFNFLVTTVLPIILQTFNAAAPVIADIITNIGSAVMTVAEIIAQAIQYALPLIEGIITVVMTIGSVVIPAVLSAFNAVWEGISSIMENIKGIFDGLVNFITGVFTGNWSQAWEGVKQIFGNAFEALVTLLKTPMNAVIALINKAISGINGLGLTIPDWVPVIGGKAFSINIPEIPMLAKGGFTNGPSIAGEAGTEAVISFDSGVRQKNIDTWMQAGRMLGIDSINNARQLDEIDASGAMGGNFTFAPNITIQGNADQGVVDNMVEQMRAMFESWYEQRVRMEARTAY